MRHSNAAAEFESIIESHPSQHSVMPYAKYFRCKSLEGVSRPFSYNLGVGKAYQCYMDFVAEFPQSEYAADSKVKLAELKNALAEW